MASVHVLEECRDPKRKRKVLTIEGKLDVCKLIATGIYYTVISDRYAIGRLTTVDTKKASRNLKGLQRKRLIWAERKQRQ